MKKAQILIVEDDMIIATDLSVHLARRGYDIVGIVTRGEDALRQLDCRPPDIVLMDINLRGSLDGIETSRRLRQMYPALLVIYLTANADDSSYERARTTHPHAFIAKPFKKRDLERTIELALLQRGATDEPPVAAPDSTPAEQLDSYVLDDRIFVRDRDRLVKIPIQDIAYAAADRNYCRVFTAERDYLLTLPLRAFEARLNARQFVRIHRSYIINLTRVEAISDNASFVSVGNRSLPVSKSCKADLLKSLKLI